MRTFPRSPRLGPLFFHGFLEACFIELHAEVASGIENKIHGQAVSVIKLERLLARINGTFLAGKRLQLVFEFAQPDVERLAKAFFLGQNNLGHAGDCRFEQFGISSAHQLANGLHHFGEKRLRRAQQPAMADCPTNDLTQHISASIVRWLHSIRHKKCRRARMVSDDP